MRWSKSQQLDMQLVRSAVMGVVEADRWDDWLMEVPEHILMRVAAPLEMLQFHYYLSPPQDRHLVRAARVCCEAVEGGMEGCPADMVVAFERLTQVVRG